ncbi:MAG: hypothetical protein M0Z94_01095 [Dehalococcoidales bacterium]|nr:hypothetical protein [Dehalococcoidales bacterium]
MSNNVNVPLPAPARLALVALAQRELRHPRQQAALLLIEALRERGVLADEGRQG